jgi:DNA primase
MYWRCFGCGATGDIFTASHWLEGLPLRGPEFITENVQVLAARFNIPFEPVILSERDLYMMNLRMLYRHASDTLVEFADQRALLDQRGWSKQLCYDMRVGTVQSWQQFRTRLMAKGDYTVKHLEDNGIYENIFNPYCITFTLFDEFGHPTGFACRDSRFGSVQNIHKFRVTETRIPIFNKREILYGFHLIKSTPVRPTMVEGYSDVLTAMQAGIRGFVAILTSTMTDEQLALMRKYGKTDIDLALDYDFESKTGQTKTEQALDDVLSGRKNMRAHVVDFGTKAKPGESLDPDEFIRQQSDPVIAWEALPKVEAFEWRLQRMRGEPPEWVSEKMIKLVLNEPQHARQEVMLKKLATFTGIREQALQADLDDHLWETDRRRRDDAKEIQEDLIRKLKFSDPLKVDADFDEAARKIKALRRDTRAIVTVNTALEMVDTIQERFLNKGEGLPGLKTNWERFDARMGGLPKEDCFFILGGVPHSGKTSYFCHLGWNVASFNEDVCVLYMSIDDAMSQIYPKFIALQTGFPIDHIAQPPRWLRKPGQMDKLRWAWGNVKQMIQVGRLEVRDATFGTSVNYLEHWVDAKKKEYPNRHVVAFLDNFHKLNEGGASIRERFRNASEHLKTISQSGRTTICMTAELTKSTDPKNPTLRDLMETVQLEHDATIAALFHNDMQVDSGSDCTWIDRDEAIAEDRRKPLAELRVAKNKNIDGAFKGTMRYRFNPKISFFTEHDEEVQTKGGGLEKPADSQSGQAPQQGMLIEP